MPKIMWRFSLMVLAAWSCAGQGPAASAPATAWLPPGAVMVVEIRQPAALLDFAVDLKIPKMITATDTYQKMTGGPDGQGLIHLIETLEAKAGTDWKGLVRKLTGRGITYAMYPGDSTVWVLAAEDPAVVDQVRQLAGLLAGASKTGYYKEFPGNTAAWSFDGKQFFASTPGHMIIVNRGDVLKALFDAAAQNVPKLAAMPQYAEARKAAGEDAVASLFINMAMVKQSPALQKTLAGDGSAITMILNGAVSQSLLASNWLSLALRIKGRSLMLHAASDGKPDASGAAAFTLPADGAPGVLPALKVPHELAAASLWRDLGKFYSQKDTLFPEKSSGGILLENFLEIFFTGRDLGEEVFGRFNPAVRLVVAAQQWDPAIGTPQEQYPAAALIFRVDHDAEAFGEVFEEAWQKAVGLTNFTRGQNAQQGLLIDKASHKGVTITYCYFSARSEKDRAHLPSRFNMRPALVRVGPYVILSTTDGLAKDLIDAVNQEDARVPPAKSNTHTLVEITNGADVAALLATNRAELIRQSVLGGKKQADAEGEFDFNLTLLKHLDGARLAFAAAPEGQQADLELRLK